ncbi:GGDEF domain-containing protein [Arthrobacter sp. K5]|jgi:diguanylate cyclase (GGDEF)-like protein|uniref:GGDEF domain-containing protein n=1 Tax=Arthrobacter sp. K5 TaxID=2839623 RepID=A0AAU8EKX8_9MICC
MILDTATLRVAFAAMALVLALLFYFSTFRSTRSPYSAWWCAALLLFLSGSASFLLNGTPQQVWANPLGNFLLVSGAAGVWAGARSLRNLKHNLWLSTALPVIAGAAAGIDSPGSNTWAGGAVFLASMATLIGLASHELWRLEPGYSRVRIPMAIAAGGVAVFYFCRLVVFLIEGPSGPVFSTYFGSAVTTMVTMVLLVVVSFSMAGLSTEQQTRALRTVATQDGLTGLLNRGAFLEAAAQELERSKAANSGGSLILADLDHFKSVNDTFGHAAGDLALQAFANACSASARSTDVAGRYGGEEFILLLPGAGPKSAEIIAGEISRRLAEQHIPELLRMPTVSYGISTYNATTADLDEVIAAADVALYEAKSQGRNRTVRG